MSQIDRGAIRAQRMRRAHQSAAVPATFYWNGTAVAASPYAVKPADAVLWVSTAAAARTINLPPVRFNAERVLTIVDSTGNAGANNITLDGNGAETINGAATHVLAVNRASVTIHCTGTEWLIL